MVGLLSVRIAAITKGPDVGSGKTTGIAQVVEVDPAAIGDVAEIAGVCDAVASSVTTAVNNDPLASGRPTSILRVLIPVPNIQAHIILTGCGISMDGALDVIEIAITKVPEIKGMLVGGVGMVREVYHITR